MQRKIIIRIEAFPKKKKKKKKKNFKIESYQLSHKTHEDHKNQHHILLKQKNTSPTRKSKYNLTTSTQCPKKGIIMDMETISSQVALDDL